MPPKAKKQKKGAAAESNLGPLLQFGELGRNGDGSGNAYESDKAKSLTLTTDIKNGAEFFTVDVEGVAKIFGDSASVTIDDELAAQLDRDVLNPLRILFESNGADLVERARLATQLRPALSKHSAAAFRGLLRAPPLRHAPPEQTERRPAFAAAASPANPRLAPPPQPVRFETRGRTPGRTSSTRYYPSRSSATGTNNTEGTST